MSAAAQVALPPPPPGAVPISAGGPPPPPPGAKAIGSGTEDKGFLDYLKDYYDQTALLHPKESAQGMTDAALHPIKAATSYGEQNAALAHKAAESFKSGNYTEAAAHALYYLLNGIPGFGARLDAAGEKGAKGDIPGMLTDTASIATDYVVGPKAAGKLLNAATEPGVVPTPGEAVAATKAAIKAGGPDVIKGGAKIAAGAAMDEMGVPYRVGTVMGAREGLPDVGRGVVKGFKAGRQVLRDSVPDVHHVPEPASIPEVPNIIPPARQLNAGAVITPPPADTSGVIHGWKPTIVGSTPESAPAPSAPSPELLDEISHGMSGKPFQKLSPAEQAGVVRVAERIGPKLATATPEPAVAAQTPAVAPVEWRTPEEIAAASKPAPVAEAPKPEPAAVESTKPPSAWLPPEELDNAKTTGLPVERHMANRAEMAKRFVDKIGGTQNLPTNQSEWARLADELGERIPSKETQAQIEFGLNRRMVTKTETPGTEAPTPSAVSKNPKEMKIAQQLQAEMNASGTATKEVPSLPVGVKGAAADIQSVGPTVPGVGATVTLKNGKTVIVKELYPDGTFDFNE